MPIPIETNSVELEVLEVHNDSSGDDDKENDRKSLPPKRKKIHKNRFRRKSKSQSCGSLYSLPSLNSNSQQSEPNVNYYVDSKTDDEIVINLPFHKNNQKDCEDRGADSSESNQASQNPSFQQNLTGGGGGGLRNSLLNVIGKLCMWKRNGSRSTSIPSQHDKVGTSDKFTPSNSTGPSYFRAFSIIGTDLGNCFSKNYKIFFFLILFSLFFQLMNVEYMQTIENTIHNLDTL